MHLRLIATIALVLIVPTVTQAQSLDGGIGNTDPFTISVSPQYPAPYSQATISFLSSSLDLTNATLTVSIGGKNIYQGSVQPVTIPTGKGGGVTNATVTISLMGSKYSKSLILQPQDVVLIAEPVSSAPVLYPGKPLVPVDGSTRVVAMANLRDAGGKMLDSKTLSYTWKVDDTFIANSSGIGRDTIIVASPLEYRERSVSVAVQSQNGSLVGGASISLAVQEPSLRIYENDPLLGIRFDHALSGTFAIQKAEANLYAAAFSFPTSSSAPHIEWSLSGALAQTGNSITLRPAGSGKGEATLSLTASGGISALANMDLSVSFGAKSSTNFFGL